jgi:hypothetical protein
MRTRDPRFSHTGFASKVAAYVAVPEKYLMPASGF